MSSTSAAALARRGPAEHRSDRVDAVVEATIAELREHGYDGLTVRNVARRAGVAPATAYTYFASKDHLVAEVFWRRVQELETRAPDARRSPLDRVRVAMREVALLVAAEPELAAASTVAVLAADPDVQRLRGRIGAALDRHLAAALGEGADPAVRRALNLALAGALLQAGMGYFTYTELADRMSEVAGVVLGSVA